MVGEYFMFFQNNTRGKFTIAQNQTLFFHQFYQPKGQWLSGNNIVVSKRCTSDLPVVNTQGSSTGFLFTLLPFGHSIKIFQKNIHETNKVVLALKRKKAEARTNAKKSNNTAFVRNPGMENVRVLDLGIQKLSTKIPVCLPSPHSTW